MSGQSDLGPALPPRSLVYHQARELQQLAQLAVECALSGPRADLRRAMATFDRMRVILGDGHD